MKKYIVLLLLLAIGLHFGTNPWCYTHPGQPYTIILPNGGVATMVPGTGGTSYLILPDGRTITIIR